MVDAPIGKVLYQNTETLGKEATNNKNKSEKDADIKTTINKRRRLNIRNETLTSEYV